MGCSRSANAITPAVLEKTYHLDTLPLGHGSFGVVLKGVEKDTGNVVAVKRIEKVDYAVQGLDPEVDIMRRFSRHKNITRFIACYETASHWQIVMEYVGGGELFKMLKEIGGYSEKDASAYTRSMAAALTYLHRNCVAHRDVKPENLLLRCHGRGDLKLCDFGCATILDHQNDLMWSACGTWSYAAPEVLEVRATNKGSYSLRCDLFSVGVILFYLLAGYHPFDVDGQRTPDEIQSYVCRGHWSFDDTIWSWVDPSSKEVVSSLLELNSLKRFSAEELGSHEWVGGSRCSTRASCRISAYRESIQMQDAGTTKKSPKSPSVDVSSECLRIDLELLSNQKAPGSDCTNDGADLCAESPACMTSPSESAYLTPYTPCLTSPEDSARDSKQKGQPFSNIRSKSSKDSARDSKWLVSNSLGKSSNDSARDSKWLGKSSSRSALKTSKDSAKDCKPKGSMKIDQKMRQSAKPRTTSGQSDSSSTTPPDFHSADVLRTTSGRSDASSDSFDTEISRSYDFSVPSGSVASAASYSYSEAPFRGANTYDVADWRRVPHADWPAHFEKQRVPFRAAKGCYSEVPFREANSATCRLTSTLRERGNMHRSVVGSLMAKVGHEDGQPKREESKGRVHAKDRKSNSNFRVEMDRKASVSLRKDGKKGAKPLHKRPSLIKKQPAVKTRDGGRKLGSGAVMF